MAQKVTKARLEANRRNAVLSTGPSKTGSTRFNAVKHGLLANGITELDVLHYKSLLEEMKSALKPEGPVEEFLTERICLCVVRLKRACRLEAEFITEALNPPTTRIERGLPDFDVALTGKTIVLDPGLPASLPETVVEHLVGSFQRYEAGIENKLYRAMNQLERLQRMRRGEKLSAPAALEVGLHIDKESLASFGNSPTNSSPQP